MFIYKEGVAANGGVGYDKEGAAVHGG